MQAIKPVSQMNISESSYICRFSFSSGVFMFLHLHLYWTSVTVKSLHRNQCNHFPSEVTQLVNVGHMWAIKSCISSAVLWRSLSAGKSHLWEYVQDLKVDLKKKQTKKTLDVESWRRQQKVAIQVIDSKELNTNANLTWNFYLKINSWLRLFVYQFFWHWSNSRPEGQMWSSIAFYRTFKKELCA